MDKENKGAVITMKNILATEHWQNELKRVLGENANTFAASLMECVTNDMQLRQCNQEAVIKEAYKAASLKLPLNKQLGSAYIIVFKNYDKERKMVVPTPTLVVGYKGYVQLAIRTGQYRTINADVVYKGELKHWDKLSGNVDLSGEREEGDIVQGYVAYIELEGGFRKACYMSLEEMAKYAIRYSPSFRAKPPKYQDLMKVAQRQIDNGVAGEGVGWNADFNAMACKTVLKKLISKYGPISIEMQNVETVDDVYNEQNNEQVRNELTNERKEAFNVDDNEDAQIIEEEQPVKEQAEETEKQSVEQPKPTENSVIEEQAREIESLFS